MKKGLIAGLILLGAIAAQAQDSLRLKPIRSFISGSSIVKKALSGAFFLVQQDYTLKNKKGEIFGRSGQQYFGRHYGIGIAAKNVLWVEKRVLYPWLMDKSYKVMAGDSLKPVQGKTMLAKYNPKYSDCNCNYKPVEVKFDSIYSRSLAYYKLSKKISSVKLHKSDIPKVGIMVTFYTSDDEPMASNSSVKMSVTKQYVRWNDARSKGEVKTNFKGNIIGGALFSENYALGSVSYHLVALYTRKTETPKKWELTAFQNEFTKKLTLLSNPDKNRRKRKKSRRRKNRKN